MFNIVLQCIDCCCQESLSGKPTWDSVHWQLWRESLKASQSTKIWFLNILNKACSQPFWRWRLQCPKSTRTLNAFGTFWIILVHVWLFSTLWLPLFPPCWVPRPPIELTERRCGSFYLLGDWDDWVKQLAPLPAIHREICGSTHEYAHQWQKCIQHHTTCVATDQI